MSQSSEQITASEDNHHQDNSEEPITASDQDNSEENNHQDNSEKPITASDQDNSEENTNQDNEENFIAKFKQSLGTFSKSIRFSLVLLWTTAPKLTVFVFIVLLLQSLIPAITVGIQKRVVDQVSYLAPGGEYDWKIITTLVSLWIGALLLDNLLNPWVNIAFIKLSDHLMASFNLKLIKKANSFADINNFENAEFYNKLEILQGSIAQEPINLLMVFSNGLKILVTLTTMFALLFTVDWWIPLLILLTYLPQTYASLKLESGIWGAVFYKSPQARRMKYYSGLLLTDTFAKEVRLFGLSSLFSQFYLEVFEDRRQLIHNLQNRQALILSALGILSVLGNGFCFCWVILQALSGKLTPGSILLLIQSLGYVQSNINQLLQLFTNMQKSMLFMELFFKFMDSESVMPICIPGKPTPKPIKSGIVFDNVEFAYSDGRLALSNISFKLNPGETVAIVGENGAGKSTLVKLLSRLYDPTQGNIFVDEENLKDLDIEQWRRQIGVVFQDFCRYALTIGQNIALGDISAMDDLEKIKCASEKSEIAAKVKKLAEGYATPLGKRFNGTEMSGGEWQKIAIARAFVREKEAQIMILDEPTAALDPRSEYEMYRSFAELVKGKTAILVTHRLASVRLADRILVLKAGKLVEVGTHEELLQQNGEYTSLWNMQAEQYQVESESNKYVYEDKFMIA
ncbi:MAG: ABC transporter ATP-binding protein [Symploca sp. SIO3E6]|nr:ABC transporter ATP-binding protein [Caldora sp. SIO3E6]